MGLLTQCFKAPCFGVPAGIGPATSAEELNLTLRHSATELRDTIRISRSGCGMLARVEIGVALLVVSLEGEEVVG